MYMSVVGCLLHWALWPMATNYIVSFWHECKFILDIGLHPEEHWFVAWKPLMWLYFIFYQLIHVHYNTLTVCWSYQLFPQMSGQYWYWSYWSTLQSVQCSWNSSPVTWGNILTVNISAHNRYIQTCVWHINHGDICTIASLHNMYMNWLSCQETGEKPDCLWQQNQIWFGNIFSYVSGSKPDIFYMTFSHFPAILFKKQQKGVSNETSRHFQPCLWQQKPGVLNEKTPGLSNISGFCILT